MDGRRWSSSKLYSWLVDTSLTRSSDTLGADSCGQRLILDGHIIMALLERLTEYIANQTSNLAPLTLPIPQSLSALSFDNIQSLLISPKSLLSSPSSFLASSQLLLTSPLSRTPHIVSFVRHITSTPVHETYYPFLRFGAIHASRVALVWAGLTKGGDRRNVGSLQDLFGYLTAACAHSLDLIVMSKAERAQGAADSSSLYCYLNLPLGSSHLPHGSSTSPSTSCLSRLESHDTWERLLRHSLLSWEHVLTA